VEVNRARFFEKKDEKTKKKLKKRAKKEKIEKKDAKRCAICGVFSKSGIFRVLGNPDGVTRGYRGGRSWWRVGEMLKWVIWVVWERKKDVYFLKHEAHEGREEKIKKNYFRQDNKIPRV